MTGVTRILVNACTAGNLLLGFLAIVLASDGRTVGAAWCIVGAVVLDGLDGALARHWEVTTPFGAQLDSLADLCSFGVAAAVLAYQWQNGGPDALVACGLIVVCAAMRLARFNTSSTDTSFFEGMPTTMAALVLAGCTAVLPALPTGGRTVVVVALAVLMISTLPYPKSSRLRAVPWAVWLLPLLAMAFAPTEAFTSVVAGYVTIGPALWLVRRVRRPMAGSRDVRRAARRSSSEPER